MGPFDVNLINSDMNKIGIKIINKITKEKIISMTLLIIFFLISGNA